MPTRSTWFNKTEDQELEQICELLSETPYTFLRIATIERMSKQRSLLMKAHRWLVTDHKVFSDTAK